MLTVLKLRNMRVVEQKNLNENNFCLYKHITSYIRATDLTMYEKEEILHQIMDMLLEAQYDNRDKRFIVGDDYKEFCKSIIDEYMISKSKLYIVLDYLQRYILWMSLWIILNAIYNIFSIGQFSISINEIITSNIFALMLLFVSKAITREAIIVPISEKSKIKVNINFNKENKAMTWYGVMIIVSLIIQLASKSIFNIDPYNYFISLSKSIFIILPVTFIFIIAISIYKLQYNRRK